MSQPDLANMFLFESEYPRTPPDDGNLREDVSQENVLSTLEHHTFNSQDIFVHVEDSDGEEQFSGTLDDTEYYQMIRAER